MIDVNTALQNILKAIYGKDVRQSIHDAIYQINQNANEAVDLAQIKFGTAVTDPTSPISGYIEKTVYFNVGTGIIWKLAGGAWVKLGTMRAIDNIAKTATVGLIDTYTITYNDGTTSDYFVENGISVTDITKASVTGNVDHYDVNLSDGSKTPTGFDVRNGIDGVSIIGISKTSTAGNVDYYSVNLSDGTITPTGFSVKNGIDGVSVKDAKLVSTVGNTRNYNFELSDGSFTPTGFSVTDGVSSYLHIRYSAQFDGTGMVSVPDATTNYIGICVSNLSTASTNPTDYNWVKFVGSNGSGTGDMLTTDFATIYPRTVDRAAALYDGTKEIKANQLMEVNDYASKGVANTVDRATELVDVAHSKIADTELLANFSDDGELKYKGNKVGGAVAIDNSTIVKDPTSGEIKVPIDGTTIYVDPTDKKVKSKSGASGGSVLHITTTDFIGKTVTVVSTDPITGKRETLTGTFDSTGLATFNVTGSGIAEISVVDTDGTKYTSSVNMTYYGIYTGSVNRFKANIIVNVDTDAIVTATDGINSYSATSVGGKATINIGNVGTFSVSANMDGVVSDDKKNVTILADKEVKIIDIKFATVTMNFTGSLVATITKDTFTKSVMGSVSPIKVYVPSLGDYTIAGTLDGVDTSATANVTSYANVDVTVSAGSNYFEDWLTAGGFTTATYPTLADLFTEDSAGNNEKAVRKLMTVHASSDILVDWYNDSPSDFPLSDFLESRLACKWIGLRDYICDKLMAIDDVKTALLGNTNHWIVDGVEKYGWEYILKDKVPVMTADNAPYGTASATNPLTNYNAFHAFDGKQAISDRYAASTGTSNNRIYYKFPTPVSIKKISALVLADGQSAIGIRGNTTTAFIEYSNDGATFTPLNEITLDASDATTNKEYPVIGDDVYASYWALRIVGNNAFNTTGSGTPFTQMTKLQFYGRALNVSVPKMDTNTTPYGKADASSSKENAYKVFDGSVADGIANAWYNDTSDTIPSVQYDFKKPVLVKQLVYTNRAYQTSWSSKYTAKYKLEGSNDGVTFEEITDELVATNTQAKGENIHLVNVDKPYKIIKFVALANDSGGNVCPIGELQFYGVDYSEREFEDGSTMLPIYDHGLELDDLGGLTKYGSGQIVKNSEDILINNNSTSSFAILGTANNLDFASHNYKTMRAKIGEIFTLGMLILSTDPSAGRSEFYNNITSDQLPNNAYVGIDTAKSNYYPAISGGGTSATGKCTITEWWLE